LTTEDGKKGAPVGFLKKCGSHPLAGRRQLVDRNDEFHARKKVGQLNKRLARAVVHPRQRPSELVVRWRRLHIRAHFNCDGYPQRRGTAVGQRRITSTLRACRPSLTISPPDSELLERQPTLVNPLWVTSSSARPGRCCAARAEESTRRRRKIKRDFRLG